MKPLTAILCLGLGATLAGPATAVTAHAYGEIRAVDAPGPLCRAPQSPGSLTPP